MVTYLEIVDPQAALALRDYLVLALRSTGPSPAEDRVWQLAMLRVEEDQIVNRASTLIDPGIPLPPACSEATGVSAEEAAAGLSYAQMAESLGHLLPGSTVVADEEAIGFLRAMLDEQDIDARFSFVDVRNLASGLLPDLEEYSLDSLADCFRLAPQEEDPLFREALLRREILLACRKLLPPQDAPEEEAPAEAEETAASEAPKKRAFLPGRDLLRRPLIRRRRAKRRPRKRMELPELSTEDFIAAIAALFSLAGALIFLPSFASLFFFLAAVLLLPIPAQRRLLARWQLSGWKILAIGAALFVLAFAIKPHTPGSGKQRVSKDGPPAFIILTWDQPGDYGENWTAVNDDGVEEQYIAFHLPTGIYRVLNNNAASARVTVCDDVPEEKSAEIMDLALEESSRSVTVLASKSKEITLDEGQHIRMSEGAENVIFQYLGEIPVEVVDEKEEEDDPNATAITAWVNGKEVRMRKSASVSAFIMATFDTGKEVLVTGEVGDWTAVTVDNQKGFIYSRYITYEKPVG